MAEQLVREAIHDAARRCFGRPIAIEERALQALAVRRQRRADHHPLGPLPQDLYWSAYAQLPAIAQLHHALGADPLPPQPVPWTTASAQDVAAEPNLWLRTFRSLFWARRYNHFRVNNVAVDRDELLTSLGERIRTNRALSIEDLILAALDLSGPDESYVPRSNLALRRLARAAGVGAANQVTPQMIQFAESAAAEFLRLRQQEPFLGSREFAIFLDGPDLGIAPVGTTGTYAMAASARPLTQPSTRAYIVEPLASVREYGLERLTELIESGAKEAKFQSFFEDHPQFLINLGDYVEIRPHVILEENDGGRLIPDFYLERPDGLGDLLELKRPQFKLVRRQQNRLRFRDPVMEAVAQARHYADWFDDSSNRRRFHSKYGVDAYKPRVIVVMGRSSEFVDPEERVRLQDTLESGVSLATFDDIADRSRRWLKNARSLLERS